MLSYVPDHLVHIAVIVHVLISLGVTASILERKRDTRAATGWLGLVWLSPYLGGFLYFIFGINRINRKGLLLNRRELPETHLYLDDAVKGLIQKTDVFSNRLLDLSYKTSSRPLSFAQEMELLEGGDSTYRKMLDAIDSANHSVYLQSYIFDGGSVGDTFIAALSKAKERGLKVCVLIDAVGSRYSFPTAYSKLKKLGVPTFKFLPNIYPTQFAFLNLRNHRKVLIIDEKLAFFGGMNIRNCHSEKYSRNGFVSDTHFTMTGPICQQFLGLFIEDWHFSGGDPLKRNDPPPLTIEAHSIPCRVISDGPDIDFEKIRWILLAAIGEAKKEIKIVTPYFLPDSSLIEQLKIAAWKGVDISIIVPRKSNIPTFDWAEAPQFQPLTRSGVKIFFNDANFDHSKFLTIDGSWSFFGSANWDNRSLRLNFEVNLEVYDPIFTMKLNELFKSKLRNSREVSIEDLTRIGMLKNLRNNLFRLLSPYL